MSYQKKIEDANKVLSEWEYKHLFAENPNERARCSQEITRIKEQIVKWESKLVNQFDLSYTSPNKPENEKEYLSRKYEEVLRSKSLKYSELLNKMKSKVLPVLDKIPETEFSHDCKNHVKEALECAYDLFKEAIENKLTAEELFVLAAFIMIHDIGMYPVKDLTPKQIYKSHHIFSRDYVLSLRDKSLLDDFFALRISELCFYHNKPLKKAFQRIENHNTNSIRMNIIFSMFRLVNMIEVEVQSGMINGISPDILIDTISEVAIDEKNKTLEIHKTMGGSKQVLMSWVDYLSNNLLELNKYLKKIDYQYEIIVKNL